MRNVFGDLTSTFQTVSAIVGDDYAMYEKGHFPMIRLLIHWK